MNWNEYKENIKQTDPVGKELIEEAESEAAIITAIISQRNALGLSQRDLANLCEIPQSSIARIESSKTTPRLDTLLRIMKQLGLTLSVTKLNPKYQDLLFK
jgi:transcriptional regulator with XRE-family HTH domain